MVDFHALYCVHVEQIGVLYPDAWHVRYGWAVTPTHIESNVFFGDEAVVFISVLDVDGTMLHDVEPYMPSAKKKARVNGLRTN
jgi:hypothetical protein